MRRLENMLLPTLLSPPRTTTTVLEQGSQSCTENCVPGYVNNNNNVKFVISQAAQYSCSRQHLSFLFYNLLFCINHLHYHIPVSHSNNNNNKNSSVDAAKHDGNGGL